MYRSRIPRIIDALGPAVEAAIKEGAEQIAEEARSRVPVATGDLRSAIKAEKTDDGYDVIAGSRDAFYGHFIEFGTASKPARPFLIPAVEARRPAVTALVAAALRKAT